MLFRIGLSLILLFMFCLGCDNTSNRLVRVGNTFIYAEQVSREANALTKAIENRLMLLDAEKTKLAETPTVKKRLEQTARKQLYYFTADKEIARKIITEEDVREAYKRELYEIRMRHIFLPTSMDKKAAIEILSSLRQRILRGEAFTNLVRSFSRDTLTLGKGGDLGFIKYGEGDFGTEFYENVMRMKKGFVSPPLQSEKGYHLVRVEQRRKTAIPSYDDYYDQLRQKLERSNARELNKAFQSFIDQLKKKYETKVNDDDLVHISSRVKALKKELPKEKTIDLLRQLAAAGEKTALIHFKKKNYTLDDFIALLEEIPSYENLPVEEIDVFKEFLDRAIPLILIIKYAHEKNYHKTEAFHARMKPYREKILLEAIHQKQIEDKITVEDEKLEAFFDKHKSDYIDNQDKDSETLKTDRFEEVKGRVLADYKKEKRQERQQQWLSDLKADIPIVYYEERK
ncbi:hypothetical protein GF407_12830 [candidate division KSB1 bacterium]|nr:hypothetical protein [candidate division KSB1 bacterium]